MYKVAALVWIVVGVTMAGIAMIPVLTVPQLSHDPMKMIPIVCAAAAVIAMPISLWIAKRIQALSNGK